ncbi:MAG: RagB/SusD family nutrient uptake outer membrane protein [Bacteroidales bacterium]|nr:RagB/SusD family nutrient uptake outer membrane protein [Bacteroidales bacterium]
MKRIKFILAILIMLTAVGCEDQFDLKPFSTITTQNMWNTENEAVSGVTGMYSQFRSTFNGTAYLVWYEFRSGFWQVGKSGADQWDDLFLNTPNATSTPNLDWTSVYKTINAANLAIKYIPDIEFGDPDEQGDLLADAYFVRAYCYFNLARLWGDVPLLVTPVESLDADNLYPVREDMAKVFTQVKSDLDEGLEQSSDEGPRNRIYATLASLNMLKADVYLWTAKRMGGGNADLTVAQSAADAVLADANYQLLPVYEDVFREEMNDETVFSIFFDIVEGPDQFGERFTFQANQVEGDYRDNPVPIGESANWHSLTDHYIGTYLTADTTDTRTGVISQIFNSATTEYRWVNKYLGDIISDTRVARSDTRIYRFAEAILFRAEALNAQGFTSEAIIELNKIAERAYGVADYYANTLTQTEVDDAILHERLIEFGAEGKSWFDIIRFGKAFELIPSLVGRESDYQGNILLLPVNPATITKNPNITQTPGY